MFDFLSNLLGVCLETAPWLLLGLLLAAVLKNYLPTHLLERWLGGTGPGPIIKASFIGAPLPLCSCGVLPAAVGLHRAGASKPATASFLISTPETGIDSVAVSYALLGPVMAIIRPVSAIASALFTGSLVALLGNDKSADKIEEQSNSPASCCSKQATPEASSAPSTCCASKKPSTPSKVKALLSDTTELLDDIKYWLAFGLVLAGLLTTLIDPGTLSQYGSGFTAMLIMLVVGMPLYICASASTPLAASFLLAGLSPGVVIVFLLAGPATNIASLGILIKELGVKAVTCYLLGIATSAIAIGLLIDAVIPRHWFQVPEFASHSMEITSIQWLCLAVLLLLTTPLLRRFYA